MTDSIYYSLISYVVSMGSKIDYILYLTHLLCVVFSFLYIACICFVVGSLVCFISINNDLVSRQISISYAPPFVWRHLSLFRQDVKVQFIKESTIPFMVFKISFERSMVMYDYLGFVLIYMGICLYIFSYSYNNCHVIRYFNM